MSYPEMQRQRGLFGVIVVIGLILIVLIWSFSIVYDYMVLPDLLC